jgi:hypothetical protein
VARRLYILDLDRTLFDTKRFFDDLLAALGRSHGLDPDKAKASMAEFVDPEAGGYDPHGHHEKLLGLSADQLDALITRELSGRDYLFPDATAWLEDKRADKDNEFVILTQGRPRYQQLKLAHAAAARSLPMVVVPSDKAGQIRSRYAGRPYDQITLVDDSAEVFEELAGTRGITLVRIARPGEKYSDRPCPPHITQITNFGELS